MQEMTIPGRRLWLTADRDRVVEDGDPDAKVLWCTEDDEVPLEEAERLGAVKAAKPGANKARKPGEDKGGE